MKKINKAFVLLLASLSLTFANEENRDCSNVISDIEAMFCQKQSIEVLEQKLDTAYQSLINLLDEKALQYEKKYKDAFFDNYEMPYKEIKIELIKSQALWKEFVESDCQIAEKMHSKKNDVKQAKDECRRDHIGRRSNLLKGYLTKIKAE